MLLAGDVGGTKTLIGVFERGDTRPAERAVRSYRTLDFPDLGALARQFLREADVAASTIDAVCIGVAGPVEGATARLTNVPWIVDTGALHEQLPNARAQLLNDLEALAWSVTSLLPSELETLREGEPDPNGGAALIAAGTGLGMALIPRVDGRLVPRASEGGHVDFAARTSDEQQLAGALTAVFGRADLERVVSGPGLANIHRHLHPHECAALRGRPSDDDLPAAITHAALTDGCGECQATLNVFVSAYGAAAGNLALTALATGGLYIGGGIAPKILPALRSPTFIDALLGKAPMGALVARMPVRLILNPAAGLIGAATYANLLR